MLVTAKQRAFIPFIIKQLVKGQAKKSPIDEKVSVTRGLHSRLEQETRTTGVDNNG